jgi:hypothetical protein
MGTQGGTALPFLQRDSASSLTPGAASPGSSQQSEAERLAAAKSTKELVKKGLSLFNSKGPLKGIESLISNGLLDSTPAAVRGLAKHSWSVVCSLLQQQVGLFGAWLSVVAPASRS